jgi:hypothetical protein
MFGTKKRDNRRWALEFLQIYHMPIMNVRQGWHLVDLFTNEKAAQKRLEELNGWNCELRIREMTDKEETEYEPIKSFD